jgi:hypothetical protein
MAMCIVVMCHYLTLLLRTHLHRIAPDGLALSFPSLTLPHSSLLNMSHLVYNDALGVLDLP